MDITIQKDDFTLVLRGDEYVLINPLIEVVLPAGAMMKLLSSFIGLQPSGIMPVQGEPVYTEASLVSFGNYLLNGGMQKVIERTFSEGAIVTDARPMVASEDIENWKEANKNK